MGSVQYTTERKQDYAMENKKFRLSQVVFTISIVAFLFCPSLLLIFLGQSFFTYFATILLAIAIIYIGAKKSIEIDNFRCPKCGNIFIGKPFMKNPFRKKCFHCDHKI